VRVALDATYSVDPQPSGIAVYSNQMLSGLAEAYPQHHFRYCYRIKQYLRAKKPAFQNVRRALLQPPLPIPRSEVFHALNQRLDQRPAKRTVTTFHDLFVMTGEYSSAEFRERFSKQAIDAARRSDLIIAVSEFTARQVEELLGVERSRLRVIPHAVSTAPSIRTNERENLILFVGALQKRKNILRLVEAFEGVNEDWKLILAGAPSGFQAAEILDRVENSSARSRIKVTGYLPQSQLNLLFARASVFAFPSLDEGFGIPVLEAMNWGIPVLTSNGSALKELAEGAALLVDPLQTEDLRSSLQCLTQDAALRAQLITKGYERCRAFTWDRSVKQTFATYTELI
jgi:glycosyltransferase involved in cell wall biosynthesis